MHASTRDDSSLTTKECSRISGFAVGTVARFARMGKFSGKKVGRRWRIDSGSFRHFLQQREVLGPADFPAQNFSHMTVPRAPFDIPDASKSHEVISQVLAFAIAFLVVTGAVLAAETTAVPDLVRGAVSLSNVAASEFIGMSGDSSPYRVSIAYAGLAAAAGADAYTAIGGHAYAAIDGVFQAYRAFINWSGVSVFQLAHATRDALPKVPGFVTGINLGLGTAVIDAAQAAIGADVWLAYATARAAPESARTTVALMSGIGDTLAVSVSRVPALALELYERVTRAPLQYLALIHNAGNLAYEGAKSVRNSLQR